MAFFASPFHIVGILVLHAKILPETKCFGLKPCFLEFDEDETFCPVFFANSGSKVDSEYRQGIAL